MSRSTFPRALTTVALLLGVLPITLGLTAAPAGADGTPDIGLDKQVEPEVLYGDTSPVALVAQNTTGTWGYNLSFRDVLPAGVSYVPGSAPAAGDPEILDDQPAAGQTTLIWTNVADLAPNNTFTLDYRVSHETDAAAPGGSVDCDASVLCVGDTYTNTAGTYVNTDPRFVPDFDPTTGEPVPGPESFTGSGTDSATSTIVPFLVEKDEPNAEGEILRGVHDHATVYTITVQNNLIRPSTGFTIEDWIPAGMEFLGCGAVDNTTDVPTNAGSALEYPGAAALTATATPADCVNPTTVETVQTDPDGAGPLPNAVYTHVVWTGLGDIAAAGDLVLRYAAGIPIRENTLTWNGATPATSGPQTANLDNNSGPETVDEQELTNYVTATGTYDGAATRTPGQTSTDDDDLTRTAEDLSIHKTGAPTGITQGEIVQWTLLVETSEYRFVEDIVITDTLPDGLCPLAEGTDFDPGSGECNAATLGGTQNPTLDGTAIDYASAVENADGSWTLTFDDLGDTLADLDQLAPSDAFTIVLPSQVRTFYQENGANQTPVVGRDGWANDVGVTGIDYITCGPSDLVCTGPGAKIDADETDGTPDVDGSSAPQQAEFDAIAKFIAAPLGDGSCPGVAGVWFTDDDPTLQFGHGDRICWRLTVDFDPRFDTRNPVVDDFIPPNTTFETGTATALPTNTVDLQSVVPTQLGQRLTWLMGVDAAEGPCDYGVEDCYAQPGERFDVSFAVLALADPAEGNNFDLIENLMKFAAQNTGGTFVPLRDAVSYELIEPVVGLTKAAVDDSARIEGDTIDYEVTVTNSGGQDALDVEVWDVLPSEIACVDVSAISDSGTCNATENRIEWTIPGPLAAGGGTEVVTYTVTVPDGTDTAAIAAGDVLDNTAGVRQFEVETNRGTRVDYVPSDNIDPTQEASANTGPAIDDESVPIEAPTLTKARSTLTDQAGNADAPLPPQATIGETVEYVLTLTVPDGTTIYDGRLYDLISTRTTYVPASTVVTFDDGDGNTTLPGTFTVGDADLTFPAIHRNPVGTGDDVFTLTFQVVVDDEAANTSVAATIFNTGDLDRNDSIGDPFDTLRSNTVGVQIVEPDLSVTKSDNAGGPVAGGDSITYTVSVTADDGDRDSTANDVVVVDTLPAGLTTLAPTAISDSGTFDAGPPQTITWTIDTIEPGETVDLTYAVTVSDDVIGGETYTNSVDVDYTSMPGAPAAERSYETDTSNDVEAVSATNAKTVDPGTRTIGQVSTYTLDITVPANVRLFDATIVDTMPDGLTFDGYGTCTGDTGLCTGLTAIAPAADTPAAGQTRLAWFLGDLTPDAAARSITLTYDAVVDPTDAGGDVVAGDELDNLATLVWNATDDIAGTPTTPPSPADFDDDSGTAVATIDVVEPNLTIDKDVAGQNADDDTLEVAVDDTLTYTVTVANGTGDTVSDAHDITVTDTVPVGIVVNEATITGGGTLDAGVITWTVTGPLAPGDDVSFTYEATIGDSAAFGAATTFPNTADIDEYFGVDETERTTGPGDYRTYTGPDDTVTVTPEFPELTIAKTSTDDATIGELFTWTVTVTNDASVATAFGIDIADTLPADWTYSGSPTVSVNAGGPTDPGAPTIVGQDLAWTDLADLGPGETLVLTFAATPSFDARDNADHENTATTTGDDGDGNDANADGPYTDTDTDSPTLTGASLGDFVWEDLDGDGSQDAGEPGIDGVTVTLYAADGTTVIETTTTASDGSYSFDVLPAGDYIVEFGQPTGYIATGTDEGDDAADSDADPVTGRTGTVTLDPGEDDPTVDAGFYRLVDLGDFVFEDTDADGVQDAGEGGVPSTTVTLRDGDGAVVGTQVTGPDGSYLFEDLPPGPYTVTFTPPDGTTLTTPNAGGDDSTDSDPDPTTGVATVDLVSGQDDLTVDAGVYTGAGIGDFIWFDLDGDGVQDDGEPGVPGATVDLLDGDGDVVDTQVTGLDGGYLFADLLPGDYQIRITTPDGTVLTTGDAGGDDTVDSDVPGGGTTGTTPQTTLTSGETDRSWDAGVIGTGSLGDYVWEDLDGDGVQDPGEPAIDGAQVTVTWGGPDGVLGTGDDIVLGTQTTDETGGYLFEDLPPGPYQVDVVPPAGGYVETFDLDGAGTPSTTITSLAAGQDRTDVDFGYRREADLSLNKAVADSTLLTGEVARYTIVVGNDGPAPAAGPITIADTAPAGMSPTLADGAGLTCEIAGQVSTCTAPGPLGVGETLTMTVDALVEGDSGPSLVNTATVESATADPTPGNNTDTAEVTTTQAADLTIDKAHTADAFVVGNTGQYTLVVANNGPSTANGTPGDPITVTDSVPAGLTPTAASGDGWTCGVAGQDVTCTAEGALAAGESLPVIVVLVDVTVGAEGGVTNSATVSGSTTVDPVPGNDTDTDPTDVLPSADLSIIKAPQGPLVEGEDVDYLLTVTNDGPSSAAADIVVTDDLPEGLTYIGSTSTDPWACVEADGLITCTLSDPLVSGASSDITLTVNVTPDGPDTITNVAAVESPTLDEDLDDNVSSGTSPTVPQSDLVIDKSHTGDFQVGGEATWVLGVANNGPSSVDGTVTVSDTLPAGIDPTSATGDGWTCTVIDQEVSCTYPAAGLAAGEALPPVSVLADVLPAAYPEVTNTATVTPPAGVVDPVEDNDSDPDIAAVDPLSDLSLAKSTIATLTVGVPARYDLVVTNNGPNENPGPVTVTDELPPGLTYTGATGDGWSCSATGQTLTCTYAGTIALDGTASVSVVVDVGPAAEGGVTNAAVVASPWLDPDPDNDVGSAEASVDASADLAVDKAGVGAAVGENATFTISVTNNGPSVDPGPITVVDTLPDGFTATSWTGDGWGCTVTTDTVTCVRGDQLAVGAAPAISVVGTFAAGFEGPATNEAAVSSPTLDPDPSNDSDATEVTVTPTVDLRLVKTAPSSVVAGSSATWVFTVTNDGPSAATDVELVDTLPDGLTYRSFTGAGWSCSALGQTVTCAYDGSIASGGSATVSLVTSVATSVGGQVIEQTAVVGSSGSEFVGSDNTVALSVPVALGAPVVPTGTGGGQIADTGAATDVLLPVGGVLIGLGWVLVGGSSLVRRRQRQPV